MIKDNLDFDKVYSRISERLVNTLKSKTNLSDVEKRILTDESFRESLVRDIIAFQDKVVINGMKIKQDVSLYKFGTFKINIQRKMILDYKRAHPERKLTIGDIKTLLKNYILDEKKRRKNSYFKNNSCNE